jgi:hypothetical protein
MLISRNVLGFSVAPNMHRVMEANGYYASIMRADKNKEDDSGLPSGTPIPCLPVDYLKERPDFWVGGIGSYVCPVDDDWALWFNWTMNSDVAVLSSVKGLNPITGQRIEGLGLEQYVEKCPIHKTEFKHGRFCTECDFKWPDQNYVSAPNPLYWDGFRSADGKVKQFYFTEDMSKSIPELVIGKDDTVPAFGFCFYTSKTKKINTQWDLTGSEVGVRCKNKFPSRPKVQSYSGRLSSLSTTGFSGISGYSGISGAAGVKGYSGVSGYDIKLFSSSSTRSASALFATNSSSEPIRGIGFAEPVRCMSTPSINFVDLATSMHQPLRERLDYEMKTSCGIISSVEISEAISKSVAEVGIGAGATISQALQKDSRDVNDWKDKPAGIIRIYFVFREQFEKYAKAGFNDLAGCKDGYLQDLPIGVTK